MSVVHAVIEKLPPAMRFSKGLREAGGWQQQADTGVAQEDQQIIGPETLGKLTRRLPPRDRIGQRGDKRHDLRVRLLPPLIQG